jgi:phosphopantothenoylcysteine decarboxylase/phosphopantothenate--cysteine ligase
MSQSATEFVTPVTMRAVSGEPVLAGLFDADAPFPIGHVQVSERASVLIVMPATANIIGKAAGGIADDAVSASILAAACPVVFVPNMNDRMWHTPAVQRNVRRLMRDGYYVVPPEEGVVVSTLRSGAGGMPSFEAILEFVGGVLGAAKDRTAGSAGRAYRARRARTSGSSADRLTAAKPAARRRARSSP